MDIKNDNISKVVHLQLVSNVYKKELFELIDKNRCRLESFFPWIRLIIEEKDADKFLQKVQQRAGYGEEFFYFIWENNKIVGLMGLHFVKDIFQNTQLAYWLDESAEGRGIVSTALKLLILYFFEQYADKLDIEIRCTPDNDKSKAVALRNGFKFFKSTLSIFEEYPNEYINNDIYLLNRTTFFLQMQYTNKSF